MKKILTIIAIAAATVMFASCDFSKEQPVVNYGQDSVTVVEDTVCVGKDSLVQCKGITKRGTQCERMLYWPDTLCFQHVGQAKAE